MPSGLKRLTPRCVSTSCLLLIALFLFFASTPGVSQGTPLKSSAPPKYDFHTETKANGIVDEVKVFDFGTRKDFVQLILKDGSEMLVLYVCPKALEEEMGIAFTKGDQISFTGSKVKQQESEVILAREVVKGADTLVFRDAKGSPIWNPRTGK